MKAVTRTTIPFFLVLASMLGCTGESTPSFSLMPDQDVFEASSSTLNSKIDILWVIDNSGSMDTSQQNIAANFESFIKNFKTKGYDFQMAVTTTDAYNALPGFNNDPRFSIFRDGVGSNKTGIRVVTQNTENLEATFLTNMLQGVSGDGDERAFQSFKTSLLNPQNAGFVRDDAFLAVIIVSDEDDFSHNGTSHIGGQYSNSNLHTTQSYVDFLAGIKSAYNYADKFSVSAIAIWDAQCRDYLNTLWNGRRIGVRYDQIVTATNGKKGDLCGNFADDLEIIADGIIQASTQFYLSRLPIVSSLVVRINNQVVPQSTESGWSYNEANNSVMFYGSFIPKQGDKIFVDFDPVTIE